MGGCLGAVAAELEHIEHIDRIDQVLGFQEEGNIPYVVENHVGTFETKPPKIAKILHNWLLDSSSKELVQDMGARSRALGRPEAVYKVRLTHTCYLECGNGMGWVL